MIPEDVQNWLRDQIWGLHYAQPDVVFSHILQALNTHGILRPRTEYNEFNQLLLTLFTIQRTQLIMRVPYTYPMQPPSLLINGEPINTPTNISIADILRQYEPSVALPSLPSKVPENSLLKPSLPVQLPSLPPKPKTRWLQPLPTPEQAIIPGSETQTWQQTVNSSDKLRYFASSVYAPQSSESSHIPAESLVPSNVPQLLDARQSPHSSIPIDLMSSTSLNISSSSVERTQVFSNLYLAAMASTPLPDEPYRQVSQDQHELERIKENISQQFTLLDQQRKQLLVNIEGLTSAISQADRISNLADSQFVPPTVDDLIKVSDASESNSLAADQAISDLLAVLPKALDSGSIELHVYLRLVRQYAREQFTHRVNFKIPARPPKHIS